VTRMFARCCRCMRVANRLEFYKLKLDRVPAFDDVCPGCGSNNVDVIDPSFVKAEEEKPAS
jgi:hypothetical protein